MTRLRPADSVTFWFPDGAAPLPVKHLVLRNSRMRGSAHDAVAARITALRERAATGALDDWAGIQSGRSALMLIVDLFTRLVRSGPARGTSCASKALDLHFAGLANDHFEALPKVQKKPAFNIPIEHCECPAQLTDLDLAVALAEQLARKPPKPLRRLSEMGVAQPIRNLAVIAWFGSPSRAGSRHQMTSPKSPRATLPMPTGSICHRESRHVRYIPPDSRPC